MTPILRPLNVAVIGAGLMGRFHGLAALRNGANLAAIADTDLDKARSASQQLGHSVKPMSPDEIPAIANLDAVHICTPPETHASESRRFLDVGLHVICEKPVASTAAETETLIEIAEARNKLICPVHQFPFQRGSQKLIRARASLGPLRHMTGEICTAGGEGMSDDGRHQLALDMLPHPLSLFRAFGASSLEAVDWNTTVAAPGELLFAGASSGIGMSFLISTRGRPTRNSLRVVGERGTGSIDLFHGFSVFEHGGVSRFRKAAQPFSHSALTLGHAAANGARRAITREIGFPGLRELIADFYAAITAGTMSPVSPEEMLDIAVARDRIAALSRVS